MHALQACLNLLLHCPAAVANEPRLPCTLLRQGTHTVLRAPLLAASLLCIHRLKAAMQRWHWKCLVTVYGCSIAAHDALAALLLGLRIAVLGSTS